VLGLYVLLVEIRREAAVRDRQLLAGRVEIEGPLSSYSNPMTASNHCGQQFRTALIDRSELA